MFLRYLVAFFLTFPCYAIEFEPWVGNYLEFEWRNTLLYQHYPYTTSDSERVHYSSDDLFLKSSLSNALKEQFSLELEGILANTRKQAGVDSIALSGRYMWSNDIAGDSISFTTGAFIRQSFKSSLHDISSFHHGRTEAEIFFSIGKEYSCDEEWDSRWWGVAGMGFADRGQPWIHVDLALEKRYCHFHEIGTFVNTLWGLGKKRLCIHDFDGYGEIQHQSVDVGLRYTYLIEYFGHIRLEYAFRIHARNFPTHNQQLLLSVLYTFGL